MLPHHIEDTLHTIPYLHVIEANIVDTSIVHNHMIREFTFQLHNKAISSPYQTHTPAPINKNFHTTKMHIKKKKMQTRVKV
jgi:hypothetical protein